MFKGQQLKILRNPPIRSWLKADVDGEVFKNELAKKFHEKHPAIIIYYGFPENKQCRPRGISTKQTDQSQHFYIDLCIFWEQGPF
jgi:hypothetical protein